MITIFGSCKTRWCFTMLMIIYFSRLFLRSNLMDVFFFFLGDTSEILSNRRIQLGTLETVVDILEEKLMKMILKF